MSTKVTVLLQQSMPYGQGLILRLVVYRVMSTKVTVLLQQSMPYGQGLILRLVVYRV